MNGTHPQTKCVAMFGALALLAGIGCQTHPTAMTNPFAASPDRVPPPATRTLLPGQAAPYYQGDPIPSMQGATQPRSAPAALASAVNATAAPARDENSQTSAREPSLASSGESSVSIPSDDNPLRSPLPLPPERPAVAALTPSTQSQPSLAVMQASFNQPVSQTDTRDSQSTLATNTIDGTSALAAQPMWRSPRIAQQSVAAPISLAPPPDQRFVVSPTVQNQFVGAPMMPVAPQLVVPQQSMGVRMRAVPSPAPQAAEGSAPRIRLPGYSQPTAAQAGVEQAAYYSSNAPMPQGATVWPGSVVQTVQITPMNAVAFNPTPASTIASVSGDGFRPRGSMR